MPPPLPDLAQAAAPLPRAARRFRFPVWGYAVVGVVALGGILVALSEYGALSLGIEQWWGLSNRAERALPVAAATIGKLNNYQVTGKVSLDGLGTTTGASPAGSSLLIEFIEHRAGTYAHTTGNVTFHPAAGQEQLLGPLLAGGAPVPFDVIASDAELFIHVGQDPEGTYERFLPSDVTYVGLKQAGWPALIEGLAESLTKGKRLPKLRLENVTTKGYRTDVAASALLGRFSMATAGGTANLAATSQLGIGDKRPYRLTATGPIATSTLQANLTATLDFGSFGGQEAVVPPTADKVKSQSVPLFLSQHGLLPADSPVGRDVARKADLDTIAVALVEYASSQFPFKYPTTDGTVRLDKDGTVAAALAPFLAALPTDPLAGDRYYGYASNGATFTLTAALENTGDPSGKAAGSVWVYSVSSRP